MAVPDAVQKALVDELERVMSAAALRRAMNRLWARGLEDAFGLAQDSVGGARAFDPADPAARRILADVGARIKDILETTRARVRGYVERATRDGLTHQELAELIRADPSGAFGRSRARMIARTESGTVYNRGSALGYRQSGRVSEVRVFDGDDCGWTSHDDPDKANGSIRPLSEAEQYPLAHPNCVRGWAPVVRR